MNNEYYKIFKQGSVTYFYSSLFFPSKVRKDVFSLYAFVRTADDFVDSQPAQKDKFLEFTSEYRQAIKSKKSTNQIIASMVELCERKGFKEEWVESFLEVMEQDLYQTKCVSMDETIKYMYGSAEVVGLMMAKIMDLPEKATASATLLGRAFQYINFIRDIAEDNTLGRQYLPMQLTKKFGLKNLSQEEAEAKPKQFEALIFEQLDIYQDWMCQARVGFGYIPKRFRVPIITSARMYDWTAKQIRKDPMVVFRTKVKPTPLQVFGEIVINWWSN